MSTMGLHSAELVCGPTVKKKKKKGITSQAAQKLALMRLSHEYQSAGIFLRVLTNAIQIRVSPLHRTELTLLIRVCSWRPTFPAFNREPSPGSWPGPASTRCPRVWKSPATCLPLALP